MAEPLTLQQKRDIAIMYMNDFHIFAIAKHLQISNRQIHDFLNDEGYLVGNYSCQESKHKWLQENWHWKKPTIKRRTMSDDGYRIVHKGEKMRLRTPYHPNGVWE